MKLTRIALILCLGISIGANGQSRFKKITSAEQLASGDYVIVGSESASVSPNYAMGNTLVDGYLKGQSTDQFISVSGDIISSAADDRVWTIVVDGETCTFQNKGNGKYLYQSDNAINKLAFDDTPHTITFAGYNSTSPIGFKFTLNGESRNILKYSASEKVFTNYAGDYSTNFTPLRLYRKLVPIAFSETCTSVENTDWTYSQVTLTRSMREGSWNTFCVPFDMTAEDIAANFGTGAEVKELTGVSAEGETYSLVFSDVTVITRNKPCLVKPTQAVSTIATGEKDVVIGGAEPAVNVTDGNGHSVTFHGNYTSMMVPRDAFFISNNSFYLADSDVTLKGFRGYFTIDGNATAKEMNICFGESDGIVRIENTAQYNQAYNLAGQRVSGDAKGMIIVNGRKVFNK